MKDYLIQLCNYNVWANGKISEFAADAGASICGLEQKSSFPTITATIIHILNAQIIWMNRIGAHQLTDRPGAADGLNADQACKLLMNNSTDWVQFIEALPESEIVNTITYNNLSGMPFQSTVFEIMTHLMNHGTFHRGQIITMFRNAGFDRLSSTDLITWYRIKKP